jgi:SAM-dependent methyltransferase
MSLSQNPETERLKQVYHGYRADPAKQAAWSRKNPGNQTIWEERGRAIRHVLEQNHFLPLTEKRILEIGCGGGQVLAEFLSWSAGVENLYGVDLLPERIESVRKQYPEIHIECANAEQLSFSEASFDLALFFTVFSSILDESMRKGVAGEARRVLKKGGAVLWYDFRYDNPGNPNVRGMRKKDIRRLFPDFGFSFQTLTLLPPLTRRLGSLAPALYPLFSRVLFLRTHSLGLFRKPEAKS